MTSSRFLKACFESLQSLNIASAFIISFLLLSPIKSNALEMGPLFSCEGIPVRFFVEGEYLYWQANLSELELDFGTSSLVQGTTGSVSFMDSEEYDVDPSFDWNSGYRVACGVQLPNNNLSLGVYWTQLKDKGHRSVVASDGTVNKGSCRASLEQIDALIVCSWGWPSVIFEPFVGVRAAKINLGVNSQVTTSITILPSTLATGVTNFDDHQHFKGIGPILGLYGDWMVACGFGMYGEGAFSVLYGNYNVKFNDSSAYSAPLSSASSSLINKHLHRFNPNLDLALGVFWRSSIYENIAININLGYEFHEYYNVSHIGVERGDLSFNGLVASLGIAF